MGIGLALAVFLIGLLFVATSSRTQWQLDENSPLDVDGDLPLPAVGYGSSTISLSALFGAYTGALFIVGKFCFLGILVGVILGLLLTSRRVTYHCTQSGERPSFQAMLYSMRLYDDPRCDRAFWLWLAFAQFGFALSELTLLKLVFRTGLHLPEAHAAAATLAVALVCYSYCLLAGYQAAFRTDVLRYIILIGMCVSLFAAPFFAASAQSPITQTISSNLPGPNGPLETQLPFSLGLSLSFAAGIALGIMPVAGAPDTWKRVLLLQARHGRGVTFVLLLCSAALPVLLISPLLTRLGSDPTEMFPLELLVSRYPPVLEGLLLLGLTSAFMSTFDSAQISGVHLLLKLKPFLPHTTNERQRYHLLMAFAFLSLALLLTLVSGKLLNPYMAGLFVLGPVAIAVGLLTGASLGLRVIRGTAIFSVALAGLIAWSFVYGGYLSQADVHSGPRSALVPIAVGTGFFFVFLVIGRLASRRGV